MIRSKEIRGPHIFGNFRSPLAKRVKKSARERREGNDKRHLEVLRKLPCCVTGRVPAGTVHHLKSGPARKERGVGMRATDRWTVPLSWSAHEELERIASIHEEQWFRDRGIHDVHELALALWHAPKDKAILTSIVIAHMGHGE